jgi:prepilin-type processing-associated H-X9-DG protein
VKRRVVVISLIIVAVFIVPALLFRNYVREQHSLYGPGGGYRCGTHLQQIGLALLLYAKDHEGRYPMRLEDLLVADGLQPDGLTCPLVSDTVANAFVFVAPGRVADEIRNDEIVVHEPPSNHDGDGASALFGDGHVEWLTTEGLRQSLAPSPSTRVTSATTTSESSDRRAN